MELKFGNNILKDLSSQDIPAPLCVVANQSFKQAAAKLAQEPASLLEVPALDRDSLEDLAKRAGSPAAVLAIGDDAAALAGKFVAMKTGARLAVVPAILGGENQFNADVLVYDNGRLIKYGDKEPDLVAVDFGLVWSGDEDLTRAAVGDVLSIATAAEDWKSAGELDGYHDQVAEQALEILTDLMDKADDIFDLTERGIKAIATALAAREAFAAEKGTRRPISGTEHVFADCLRQTVGRDLPHGPLLCLSMVLMTEMQGKSSRPAKQFLHWIAAPWKPENLRLSDADVRRALLALPAFAKKNGCPPTALDKVEMTEKKAEAIIRGMREHIVRSSLMDRDD